MPLCVGQHRHLATCQLRLALGRNTRVASSARQEHLRATSWMWVGRASVVAGVQVPEAEESGEQGTWVSVSALRTPGSAISYQETSGRRSPFLRLSLPSDGRIVESLKCS